MKEGPTLNSIKSSNETTELTKSTESCESKESIRLLQQQLLKVSEGFDVSENIQLKRFHNSYKRLAEAIPADAKGKHRVVKAIHEEIFRPTQRGMKVIHEDLESKLQELKQTDEVMTSKLLAELEVMVQSIAQYKNRIELSQNALDREMIKMKSWAQEWKDKRVLTPNVSDGIESAAFSVKRSYGEFNEEIHAALQRCIVMKEGLSKDKDVNNPDSEQTAV